MDDKKMPLTNSVDFNRSAKNKDNANPMDKWVEKAGDIYRGVTFTIEEKRLILPIIGTSESKIKSFYLEIIAAITDKEVFNKYKRLYVIVDPKEAKLFLGLIKKIRNTLGNNHTIIKELNRQNNMNGSERASLEEFDKLRGSSYEVEDKNSPVVREMAQRKPGGFRDGNLVKESGNNSAEKSVEKYVGSIISGLSGEDRGALLNNQDDRVVFTRAVIKRLKDGDVEVSDMSSGDYFMYVDTIVTKLL